MPDQHQEDRTHQAQHGRIFAHLHQRTERVGAAPIEFAPVFRLPATQAARSGRRQRLTPASTAAARKGARGPNQSPRRSADHRTEGEAQPKGRADHAETGRLVPSGGVMSAMKALAVE